MLKHNLNPTQHLHEHIFVMQETIIVVIFFCNYYGFTDLINLNMKTLKSVKQRQEIKRLFIMRLLKLKN